MALVKVLFQDVQAKILQYILITQLSHLFSETVLAMKKLKKMLKCVFLPLKI